MSHELAIHRVDAQLARGQADPVDAELAADGIEEIFLLLTRVDPGRATAPGGRSICTARTTNRPSGSSSSRPDGIDVTRQHAKGDLALKAGVSDLEMLLYQRPTVAPVERFGDESVLEAFHREFTF